jgi:methylenetetrahydrofolate dehydrogenase (NADP+)/methenyltetrahydrofolate cyclohydrolase
MIIDGKQLSGQILKRLKGEVKKLSFKPVLIVVVVGEDPVSATYVKIKARRAQEIGVDFVLKKYPVNVGQKKLERDILAMNKVKNLAGIIVQLPLPKYLDKQEALNKIDPKFDVDVITSTNIGDFFTGEPCYIPAAAGAVLAILKNYKVEFRGKRILVVGAGDLVGKPAAHMMIREGATVTVVNKFTKNLKDYTSKAEIIITGVGKPKLITGSMVSKGAVVIDAGTSESGNKIAGDVDFDSVSKKAKLITPVPGGVGPVTVAMLLTNVLQSAKKLSRTKKK